MATITGANAVFTLAIAGVFSTPQQVQGFASDDSFAVQAIRRAEVLMGVDGVLSGGKVFMPIPQSVMLQADSISADLLTSGTRRKRPPRTPLQPPASSSCRASDASGR